jgi:hypothetical protein
MDILLIIAFLGVLIFLFQDSLFGSSGETTTPQVQTQSKQSIFKTTDGKWDDWHVSFDENKSDWVVNHSYRNDLNEILLNTGVFIARKHIELFIKGMEVFAGQKLDLHRNEDKNPDYIKWTSFLKKSDVFKEWSFDTYAWHECVYVQDFFWYGQEEDVQTKFNYLDSSLGIDKQIDLFIAYAQSGEDPDGLGIKYLTSELELLIYDDPNKRQFKNPLEEKFEEIELDDDDSFISDIQFTREKIELLMRLCTETYLEISSSVGKLEFNEEKYFSHWIEKVKKISDFSELWFPEKNQIVGCYYASHDHDSNKSHDVSSSGVKVLYNGKLVDCLWSQLWSAYPYSPMLNFYKNFDELTPMEIDEEIDEFIEEYADGSYFSENLYVMSRPSYAPLRSSVITI